MKPVLLILGSAVLLSAPDSPVFAANVTAPLAPIRGEVIIQRTASVWESQPVQEPCVLPNPKVPARLVMFYSGVPAYYLLHPRPAHRRVKRAARLTAWQIGRASCRERV